MQVALVRNSDGYNNSNVNNLRSVFVFLSGDECREWTTILSTGPKSWKDWKSKKLWRCLQIVLAVEEMIEDGAAILLSAHPYFLVEQWQNLAVGLQRHCLTTLEAHGCHRRKLTVFWLVLACALLLSGFKYWGPSMNNSEWALVVVCHNAKSRVCMAACIY